MLLLSLPKGPSSRVTICPVLWAGALLPAPGLLSLPLVASEAWRTGPGSLWALLALAAFFLAIFAYAFCRAALAQQVRCERRGSRLLVSSHTEQVAAEASTVLVAVEKNKVGHRNPLTVHDVLLRAPGWSSSFLVHRGFSSGGASRAARRLQQQLDLSLSPAQRV